MIILKTTTIEDLETLFHFQKEEASNHMAAFTAEDPNDKEAYMTKWCKIVENPEVTMQSIWSENAIIGSVLHFTYEGETNVSYIIDNNHWGKGIATAALKQFIQKSSIQVFYARVAFDNIGSQKVLEKNNFERISVEKGFANARKKVIEEFVYKLERVIKEFQ